MLLDYRFETEIAFDGPVVGHMLRLRVLPAHSPRQSIVSESLVVTPAVPVCDLLEPAFGNRVHVCRIDEPHSAVTYCASGQVKTSAQATDRTAPAPYLAFASPLTRPGPALRRLHAKAAFRSATVSEQIESMARAVHEAFAYTPGSTGVRTAAETALAAAKGVCQDYSHVMLALLRLSRIPCRYVSGLFLGCDVSHAWVEAWNGCEWIAIDPTHLQVCDERYVTIARGADFDSAAIERGIFRTVAPPGQIPRTITQTMRTRARVLCL